jgi:hypothetical protein
MAVFTWCLGILATLCMGMGIVTFLGEPQALVESISGVLNGALASTYEFWFWIAALLFLATIALAVAGGGGGGGGEEY